MCHHSCQNMKLFFLVRKFMSFIVFYHYVFVDTTQANELGIEIELRNYTWKNMDKVQSFFSKVFPLQYELTHFITMMYGDLVKLAFHGKEMIGFLYSHTDLLDTDVFVISSIGCLPKYRRQGVGSYLFEYALNYAEKRRTYKIIRLHVQTENNVALKFYKKFGFRIINEEPDYYNNVVNVNAYRMEKIIHSMTKVNSSRSK